MTAKQNDDVRGTHMLVVLGTNGTGKTTFMKKTVSQTLKQGRRVLIVTPHDVEWESVPLVSSRFPERMGHYAGARRIIYEAETLELVKKHYRNGLLLFDDCRSCFGSSLDKDLHSVCVGRRQLDVDIFAVGHGFTEVPPKFFTFATHFVLFKTKDNIDRRKREIRNFDAVAEAQRRVNQRAQENPHYYEIIKL